MASVGNAELQKVIWKRALRWRARGAHKSRGFAPVRRRFGSPSCGQEERGEGPSPAHAKHAGSAGRELLNDRLQMQPRWEHHFRREKRDLHYLWWVKWKIWEARFVQKQPYNMSNIFSVKKDKISTLYFHETELLILYMYIQEWLHFRLNSKFWGHKLRKQHEKLSRVRPYIRKELSIPTSYFHFLKGIKKVGKLEKE